MKKKIGVVGSINTDLVFKTDVLPKIGETINGKEFAIMHGGKGANEAVACARLGQSTMILSCVGDDMFSKNEIANLHNEGVHITAVKQFKNTQGGIATIIVHNSNNQIIVVPGANTLLNTAYIKKYTSRIKECSIIGCQFEVPIDSLLYLSKICKENNIKLVLNPSPIKEYPRELFDNATFVIVNEIELKEVFGYNPKKPLDVLKQYPNKLIVTQGADGVSYHNGKEIITIPSIKVNPVDTTGAGDTFLGSFMVAINNEMPIHDAIAFANICAGLKTTKLGAQTGMPYLKDVQKYIKQNKIKLDISSINKQ